MKIFVTINEKSCSIILRGVKDVLTTDDETKFIYGKNNNEWSFSNKNIINYLVEYRY